MDDFHAKSQQIKTLAENPDVLSAHIETHLHDLHESLPMISQGLANSITNGAQYLNSKIPRPVVEMPLSSKFEPSDAQLQKFNRHFEAVSNPIDVLKEVKSGTLTGDHMEALQAVHPELLGEMRTKLISSADPEKVKDLPYHIQKSISMFLGQPIKESMLPQVAAANQAIYQTQNQLKQAQMQAFGKTTQKGLEKLNQASRSATQVAKQEIGKV